MPSRLVVTTGLCNAVLRSIDCGRPCGRVARYETAAGPRCGYHEPASLAARIARVRGVPPSKAGAKQ